MRLIAPPARTILHGGLDRRLGADALEHGVGAVAAGQFQDAFDTFLAALGDDVGGAELAAQIGAVGVPAHQDDLLGAQPLRGQHAAQSDGAVADDGHGVAGLHPGGDRAVVAGAEHVGQRQQRRHERRVRGDRQLDQRALGQRHPHRLALAGVHAGRAPSAAVAAGDLQARRAEVAGVVRPHERRHHQVAGSEAGDLRADLLDDADELVAHPAALLVGGHRLVRPQVAAADARGGDADDRVGGLVQHGVGHVLDAHVAGLVHHGCSHGPQSTSDSSAAWQ